MSAAGREATAVRRAGCVVAGLAALGLLAACGERDRSTPGTVPDRGESLLTSDLVLHDEALDFTEPDLAATPDGDLALVWLAFDGGRDRVMVSFRTGTGWTAPEVVAEQHTRHFSPRVAADPRGGFVAAWSAWDGQQADVFTTRLAPGAIEAPVRLTEDPGADTDPSIGVSADGTTWVLWQARRAGGFDILARRADHSGFGPEIPVSDHPASDVQPALGIGSDGSVFAAFSSWRDGRYADGNYEVYVRRLDEIGEPVRVSTSPHADMLPRFVALPDGLALVWTEAAFEPIRVGDMHAVAYDNWSDKTYQVSRSVAGRFGPPLALRLSPEEARGSVASVQPLAVRGVGDSLWILFGDRVVLSGFERPFRLALSRVDGEAASQPIDLSAGIASPVSRYAAAWSGDQLWIVDEIDAQAKQVASARSALRVRHLAPDRLPESRPLASFPRRERVPVDASLALDGAPRARPTARVGDRTLRAYFGNLHLHSDYSGDRRGFEGRPEDNFQVLWDLARLDFAALSDHAETLREVDWWATRKLADLWNQDGAFVTLPGYEWTSLVYGHRNVFFPDSTVGDQSARFEAPGRTPEDLFAHLGQKAALVIPHHPSHGFAKPVDWSFRNDDLQRLVEIFQKRGSYEYDGAPVADIQAELIPGHSVRDALAMGHRLGIIASPDHGGGLGLAGVWADTLSRESIFEALHARRTFGTTGPKMHLFLTVNEAPQGSEILRSAGPVRIRATVEGTAPGLVLTLVRDGVELAPFSFDGYLAELDWADEEPGAGPRYYYLRARQSDGHIGWTSPVWLDPPAGS